MVDFTVDSLRTTMDQTGVDVIDNAGNTASELTSTALTLGDLGGNASLGKAGIEAANNLKDAISGEITDTTNANQSVLIYDASSAKVSKASTFRLNESATEFATLSPFAVQLKNGNNYNNVTTSGLTTYYAPSNALSTLSAAPLPWGLEEVITTLTQAYHTASSGKATSGSSMVPTCTLSMPQRSRQQSISQQCPQQPQPQRTRWWFTTQQQATTRTTMPAGVTLPTYIKPTAS
jgi:hypothetical protein